ncbi:MAG: hypothetical protein LBL96_07280 [Clostridiales bacterium]|jgi:hypothetical protein|nr:hypothetical protein [Clostridiales bacterium]
MENINLSDTTSLNSLFDMIDSWGNLPSRSLSAQQTALVNLKNSVFYANSVNGESKNGGKALNCFICITGA